MGDEGTWARLQPNRGSDVLVFVLLADPASADFVFPSRRGLLRAGTVGTLGAAGIAISGGHRDSGSRRFERWRL